MWSVLAGLLLSGASSTLEVGFCDADTGEGFYDVQPDEQLERWETPYDNGTHLIINWKISPSMSGRNVSAYHVDVTTSFPVLNLFVGPFGGFPQDVCAPGGSKARNAVNPEGSSGNTCMPYSKDAHLAQRRTTFEIPAALRAITRWDIVVTVRGYGSCAPSGHPEQAELCHWWCHKYQRQQRDPRPPAAPSTSGTQPLPPLPPPRNDREKTQRFPNPVASAFVLLHSHVAGWFAKLTGGSPPPVHLCYGRRC